MARPAILALLLLAHAAEARATEGGIAVELTGSCPARAQVVAALEARMPGVTALPGRRLTLVGTAQAPVLELRAADGRVEVERPLAVAARPSAEGCEALAEAAALVVVRYLREIGYRPPPPPAPSAAPIADEILIKPYPPGQTPVPAAVYLGLAGSGRLAPGASGQRAEALVGIALHRGWLAAELSAGATSETAVAVSGVPGAGLRLRSFPLRLGVGTPIAAGPGFLVATAGVSMDLLSFRASGLEDARRGLRLEPAAELAAGYLVEVGGFYGRVMSTGGWNLGPRDFDAGLMEPVFRTPSAYLRLQIEVGVRLWKNPAPGRL